VESQLDLIARVALAARYDLGRDKDWEWGWCRRSRVMGDAAADGVIRDELPDDTLLVFLSDTHIGGAAGRDIFESAAELTLLLDDLNHHHGPVELVLAGDFLDILRMEGDSSGDRVAATITRPEYQELFRALQAFAGVPGHRVVYLVGNHDAEVWWNPQIQRSLRACASRDEVEQGRHEP
jgi:hypothetical protein